MSEVSYFRPTSRDYDFDIPLEPPNSTVVMRRLRGMRDLPLTASTFFPNVDARSFSNPFRRLKAEGLFFTSRKWRNHDGAVGVRIWRLDKS